MTSHTDLEFDEGFHAENFLYEFVLLRVMDANLHQDIPAHRKPLNSYSNMDITLVQPHQTKLEH